MDPGIEIRGKTPADAGRVLTPDALDGTVEADRLVEFLTLPACLHLE